MEHSEGRHGSGPVILSFFIGGLIGAGVALLLAPKSGTETRQKIKDLAEEVKGKAEHYVEQAKGKVSSALEKGKETYEEKKSTILAAVDAGKEAYQKERERHAKGDS
jgi:gas vesicle protein